jgi:hypothetical protein
MSYPKRIYLLEEIRATIVGEIMTEHNLTELIEPKWVLKASKRIIRTIQNNYRRRVK